MFYTGAAPNQQIIPAMRWSFGFLNCKRLFLVGSDYIFPRAANEIIRDEVARMGVMIVGETYIPSGAVNIGNVVTTIAAVKPDLVFRVNTINGDSNIVFFRSLNAMGITPDRIPTLSFSIGENELRNLEIAGNVRGMELLSERRSDREYAVRCRHPRSLRSAARHLRSTGSCLDGRPSVGAGRFRGPVDVRL